MVTTFGELLSELVSYDLVRESARRTEDRMHGAPERGTRDGFYALRAFEKYKEARQILERIQRSPGYAQLKTVCEAEYGRISVERLQQMRGRLAMATGQVTDRIDELSLQLFANEYLKRAASPGLAKLCKSNESLPSISVSRWSDLAVGVDQFKRIWARTPPPALGEPFELTSAIQLHFGGEQWPKLLKLLAESADGSSVKNADLFIAFGYMDTSPTVPTDRRARSRAIQFEIENELPTRINPALQRLRGAVTTLSQTLREQVAGPTGRGNSALSVEGDRTRAGFVVRYLVPDEAGHYFFGRRVK
jgi:hypothetical protein